MFSSDDEDLSTQLGASESEDEGIYPFRRNRNCNYFKVMIFLRTQSSEINVKNLYFSLMLMTLEIGHGNLNKTPIY